MPGPKRAAHWSGAWINFVVGPRLWQSCAMTVLVAILVYLFQTFFVHVAFYEDQEAVWWPMNGIALGTLLMIRRRHWPWVLAAFAAGIACTESHERLPVLVITAVSNTLEVLGPALVLPHFRTMNKWLAQPGLAARFLVVAILLAPALSSAVAPLYYRSLTENSYWLTSLRWAAGDMLGIALFTPLLLALFSPEMWLLFRPAALPKTAGLLFAVVAVGWFVFNQNTLPIVFVLYPVLLLTATQLGLSGAMIAIDLLALIATAATIHASAPLVTFFNHPASCIF